MSVMVVIEVSRPISKPAGGSLLVARSGSQSLSFQGSCSLVCMDGWMDGWMCRYV